MKYKALIVDDEKMARALLEGMIAEFCPDIELVESCIDLPSAIKSIHKNKPDLVFLDIEMPGHSGLELLDFFDEKDINFSIIFTTAYHQYAINALKLAAIDYLLKPLESEELEASVARFIKIKSKIDEQQKIALKTNLSTSIHKKIAIHTVSSIRFLDVNEISFLKADGAYTEFYLNSGEKIISSKGLKHFEDVCSEIAYLFRCHKSFIVNINAIDEYVKSDGGYLKMNNKLEVQFSSEKAAEIQKRLGLNN
ncbi:MAG: LytR/AlgR family response regulator transcription factor [Flavobacteriia bacterium]|jgi:two-component system LytT family response regulator